jgi:hypothetical protein
VAAASRIGHRPGVALAFSFAIAVALTGVIVGARLPVSSHPADLKIADKRADLLR